MTTKIDLTEEELHKAAYLLQSGLQFLPVKDQGFAKSLADQGVVSKKLSAKQIVWLHKMADAALKADPAAAQIPASKPRTKAGKGGTTAQMPSAATPPPAEGPPFKVTKSMIQQGNSDTALLFMDAFDYHPGKSHYPALSQLMSEPTKHGAFLSASHFAKVSPQDLTPFVVVSKKHDSHSRIIRLSVRMLKLDQTMEIVHAEVEIDEAAFHVHGEEAVFTKALHDLKDHALEFMETHPDDYGMIFGLDANLKIIHNPASSSFFWMKAPQPFDKVTPEPLKPKTSDAFASLTTAIEQAKNSLLTLKNSLAYVPPSSKFEGWAENVLPLLQHASKHGAAVLYLLDRTERLLRLRWEQEDNTTVVATAAGPGVWWSHGYIEASGVWKAATPQSSAAPSFVQEAALEQALSDLCVDPREVLRLVGVEGQFCPLCGKDSPKGLHVTCAADYGLQPIALGK